MVSSLVRPVRRVVDALVAHGSPRELAAGFAIGVAIGLVPKGNLIAVSLVVLLFSLRVNTGIGLVAALLFSPLGPMLDPFAHKTGVFVLSIDSLQGLYAATLNAPLGPWFAFNNTVVTGSFAVGLYLMYPVYWLSHLAFNSIVIPDEPSAEQRQSSPPPGPRLFATGDVPHRRAA